MATDVVGMGELELDEFGRVVLSDSQLQEIDNCIAVPTAGGTNTSGCNLTNSGCTNSGDCLGSFNTNCTNGPCDGSTNGNCKNRRELGGGGG